jgi:drug/metabolite transporter (DMT)-like permease
MRVAAPEFGAIPLIEVRLVAAALVLMPIILMRSGAREMLQHWRPIAMMAVLHYALPFCLFAYALLTLTGSFTAIINASTPLFGGVIAWIWIGERLPALRIVGLLVGFGGVVLLVRDKVDLNFDTAGVATVAAMSASFCYGLAAVLAKRHLTGVSPLAVAAGSMFAGTIILFPFAIYAWPEVPPSKDAWIMAILLGVLCTAIAFVLYFRLIGSVGPTKATTVTFLIPAFAVAFGALLLDEPVTMSMIAGGAVILVGTALSTGLLKLPQRS